MFKATSESSQRRTVAAAKRTRPVIDPTVFKSRDEVADAKAKLILEKKAIESELSRVKADISDAIARRFTANARLVPQATQSAWLIRKSQLIEQMRLIEIDISALKRAKPEFEVVQKKEFDAMFKKMAQQMLAEDVYERIIVATTHRLGRED